MNENRNRKKNRGWRDAKTAGNDPKIESGVVFYLQTVSHFQKKQKQKVRITERYEDKKRGIKKKRKPEKSEEMSRLQM